MTAAPSVERAKLAAAIEHLREELGDASFIGRHSSMVDTNEDTGSRWYCDPDDPGITYQSVTWTISASESAPWLMAWAAKLAVEYAVEHWGEIGGLMRADGPRVTVAFLKDEARRQRELAAEVGTWHHDVLEAILLDAAIPDPPKWVIGRRLTTGGEDMVITQEVLDRWADGIVNFISDYRLVPVMSEATVCNPIEGYAARVDLGAEFPGHGLGLVDMKGLALDTQLPTPTGWTTMGAIQPGDEVFDSNGHVCCVTGKSAVKQIGTYIVTFDDGSKIVCDPEHLWSVSTRKDFACLQPIVRGIEEIRADLTYRGQAHNRVRLAGALDLPDVDVPIDPYLLGCWLGDGRARGGDITKEDDLFDILAADGHALGVRQAQPAGREHVATRTVIGLVTALRAAGLQHNKHIPAVYLRASTAQRMRLLQGLFDTDGSWNIKRHRAVFYTTDKALGLQVRELALSLGQRANFCESTATGYGKTVNVYTVELRPVGINPFRLPRKAEQAAASTASTTRSRRRVIVSVEPGPDVPTACIAVDSPDHTYLCGEAMIPTHNTGAPRQSVMAQLTAQKNATEVWLPLGGRVEMPRFEWGAVLHLRQVWERGYKLRRVPTGASQWAWFRAANRLLKAREEQPDLERLALYPPVFDEDGQVVGVPVVPMLEDTGLRCSRALTGAGLRWLSEVAEFTADDLLSRPATKTRPARGIKGVGPKGLEDVRVLLRQYGLALAGEMTEATEVA